jgi:chorismate mutase / prephenate dehydratase
MSDATSTSGTEPAALPLLREELDRIDDAIHDLLMQRAGVVSQVAALGRRTPYRPGREANIIHRLLARHRGLLPPQAVVRIWRELLSATTAMQGRHVVAVCEPDPIGGVAATAREHFGALTPLRLHRTPEQAMADVSHQRASVAVLPLPTENAAPRDAWWTALMQTLDAAANPNSAGPALYVVARLPFWSPRPEGTPRAEALVVADTPPDPAEHHRSLLGIELPLDLSRAKLAGALVAAGLRPESIILRRDQNAAIAHALVEIPGHLSGDDPRLTRLDISSRPPLVLGGYAVPEPGTTP